MTWLTKWATGAPIQSKVRRDKRDTQTHGIWVTDSTTAVVARFRPQNKIEIASGGEPIVEFKSDDTCTIQVRHASSRGMESRVTNAVC